MSLAIAQDLVGLLKDLGDHRAVGANSNTSDDVVGTKEELAQNLQTLFGP
jgi:hypothetical protein